jgi:hypothetical protein
MRTAAAGIWVHESHTVPGIRWRDPDRWSDDIGHDCRVAPPVTRSDAVAGKSRQLPMNAVRFLWPERKRRLLFELVMQRGKGRRGSVFAWKRSTQKDREREVAVAAKKKLGHEILLCYYVRNNMDWMDNCIEAQWGLYIKYMRETLDYTITIIPLTIIPLTGGSTRKCI